MNIYNVVMEVSIGRGRKEGLKVGLCNYVWPETWIDPSMVTIESR